MKKVIMPVANTDFDPSEVAVTWKLLKKYGHQVIFASSDGKQAHADPIMLSGEGLDPWGWIPIIKKFRLFGLLLRANKVARTAYEELKQDTHFLHPISYSDLQVSDYDGLFLPGGHASGVKEYLESKVLQEFVADFLDADKKNKSIAAICHGVVIAARATSKKSNKSALYGRKTTALPWQMERKVWLLTKYFCRFWDGQYYRTYIEKGSEPPGYRSVESEVKRALKKEKDFITIDRKTPYAWIKNSGLFRDSESNSRPAWVVKDGNYLSARWPGDIHTLVAEFDQLLNRKNS